MLIRLVRRPLLPGEFDAENVAGMPAQYPRLAGQYAEYIEAQLKLFKSGQRANDPNRMLAIAYRPAWAGPGCSISAGSAPGRAHPTPPRTPGS